MTFNVDDHVIVRFHGESYFGIITHIKWNLAYVKFESSKSQWVPMDNLEHAK